jgi:hypothetical protein
MRLFFDVLQAAPAHLPESFRVEHARLFSEAEHLEQLAARLFQFARQGIPEVFPPPHFSAECTPPLCTAFAPFREVVVAWHLAPDSPELPALMARALVEAGCGNILVLLGQRRTPASLTDARAIPPRRAQLIASAVRPHAPGEALTVAGRALTKHAARARDDFWGAVTGSSAQKNALALQHIEHLLDHTTWWNVFGHFQHEVVYEARVHSGQGARWGRAGETFIGFLEPFDETAGVAGDREDGEPSADSEVPGV